MTRRRLVAVAVLALLLPGAAASAAGHPEIKLGIYSQSEGTARASAGAEIAAGSRTGGRPPRRSPAPPPVPATSTVTIATPPRPSYPSLPADASLLLNPAPLGGGSFWYEGGPSLACIYVAASSPPCYRITGDPTGDQPGLDPEQIAASVATRMQLAPGRIQTSPAKAALTGAPAWFWLEPAPVSRTASIALAGVTVTVAASPSIDWAFGDGAALPDAGPGRPYGPRPEPSGAVVHTYQTRCLPGDQGRNPNVLASCAADGYQLIATVSWRFSYQASGRIDASGTLPARGTQAEVAYPVSEARAFLVGARR